MRVLRILALFATSLLVATAMHALKPTQASAKVQQALQTAGEDGRVVIKLHDGRRVMGRIAKVNADEVRLRKTHGQQQESIRVADIQSVQKHETLRDHFHMGPCVDPITLTIASPFLFVAWASGH